MKSERQRYNPWVIAIHWGVVLLMVAVYASIQLREVFPKGSDPREALKIWHFMLGGLVFFLLWLRLALRFVSVTPAIVPDPPRWQHLAAKAVHLALYGFLILMPLLGWLALSAAGKPIPFFGLELPALLGEDRDLAHTLEEIHETIGEAGYFLIGAHAAGALFHHYLMGDNTLERMLPKRS